MFTDQGATVPGRGGSVMFMGSGEARETAGDGLNGAADADNFLLGSP